MTDSACNVTDCAKLKIVFMNSIPKDVWRGGEKWMVNAAAGLSARGHDIYCIGKNDAVWLEKAASRGLKIKPMNIHADFDPVIICKLVSFFRRLKPDILVCNFEKDVRLGGVAARIAKVKVTFVRKGLSLLYEKFLYRMAYKYWADRVITPSHFIKKQFEKFNWLSQDRIHVVHNGVEIPDTAQFDKDKILSLSNEISRPVLFAAGSLFWQKGFEFLIEAVKLLNDKGLYPHVVIAGAGDKEPYRLLAAKLGVEKYIHFAGHRNDVTELMYGADCFVLSSVDEGLPNVVLEAMAVGTAVVAADAGGTAEIISDGSNGYVVPIRDANALAQKIAILLRDNDLRNKIAACGRDTVVKKFTIKNNVDEVEKLFLKYAGEKQTDKKQ